jgi:hypothetical protein
MARRSHRSYTPRMRISRLAAAAVIAAALAACAGPRSRIKKHQADFDSYPPAVQQKIRAGQVDVGFTDQQVSLALGRPDRVYSRKTATSQQEVWAYGGGGYGPQIGFGLGMGSGAGPGFYSGGIAVASDPSIDRGERVRVVFENGTVVAVESRRK